MFLYKNASERRNSRNRNKVKEKSKNRVIDVCELNNGLDEYEIVYQIEGQDFFGK